MDYMTRIRPARKLYDAFYDFTPLTTKPNTNRFSKAF
jgi:hypothetical protein